MLGGVLDEVIDSFIPWKDISKAYFQAKSGPIPEKRPDTPAPPPEEAPKPTLSFGQSETVEFETDNEDEERPRLTLGDDVQIDLGIESEDEEPAAKPEGTMKLDL